MQITKGHIDATLSQPTCLRNAVTPAVLTGSTHHHQATVLELDAVGLFTFDAGLAFEQKPTGAPQ